MEIKRERQVVRRGGSGKWLVSIVLLICELLVNGIPPSAVPANIQTVSVLLTGTAACELPSIYFVRKFGVVLQTVNENLSDFLTRQRQYMASAFYWRKFSTVDRFPKFSYWFDGERQAWSGNCVIMYVCLRWDIRKICGVYSRNSKVYFVPWIYFRVWFISHKSIWYYFYNYSAY